LTVVFRGGLPHHISTSALIVLKIHGSWFGVPQERGMHAACI
jgi:hypothetical protein